VRAPTPFMLALVLLVATACGSREGGAAEGEPTSESTPATTLEGEAEGSWTGVGWSIGPAVEDPTKGPPDASKIAVFREPAKPSDSFTPSETDLVEGKETPERFRPGEQLFDQARLLVRGDAGFKLFGVPTEKGWVCLHFVEPSDPYGFGRTCIRRLTYGEYAMSGTESRFEIYALVADDIRRVEIVARGQAWSAVVGRNAFVFQAHPHKVCPADIEELVFEDAAGKTRTHKLAPPVRKESDEESRSAFGCR
jgi:hypothetical protein